MAFLWPAVAAIGGALISRSGQKSANEANINLAQNTQDFNAEQAERTREFNASQAQIQRDFNSGEAQISREWSAEQAQTAMDFSGGQAQEQMDFQERMANTSYQRAIGDLEKAGLNPMLAYQQGGAASPSGAMGSSSVGMTSPAVSSAASAGPAHGVKAEVANTWAPALNGALAASRTVAEIENIQAATEKVREETKTETFRSEATRLTQAEIQERTQQIMRVGELTDEQVRKVRQEVNNLQQDSDLKAVELYLGKLEMLVKTAKSEAEVNEALAEAAAWAKFPGRAYVRDAAGIGGSAASVTRALGNIRGLGR